MEQIFREDAYARDCEATVISVDDRVFNSTAPCSIRQVADSQEIAGR